MIDERSTLRDVCFAVSRVLEVRGIDCVLTGGSAASLYAPDAYASLDADFVLVRPEDAGELSSALATLGYRESKTRGMYEHEKSAFTVDFPKGPLAVGGDYVRESATLELRGGRLRLLTATDCVRDRLAHFYFWDDYAALGAAVAVASCVKVKLKRVRDWTLHESTSGKDYMPKFQEFRRRLKLQSAPR